MNLVAVDWAQWVIQAFHYVTLHKPNVSTELVYAALLLQVRLWGNNLKIYTAIPR
jgi:hypothetical protein